MITKWYLGFLAACDSACIIYGIYRLSFSDYVKRSTSLNNVDRTANIAPPATVVVVVLDGVMVALTKFFYKVVSEIA